MLLCSGGGGVGGAPAGLQNLALQDALQQALAMQGHTDPSVLLSLQGLAGLDMQTNGKVLQVRGGLLPAAASALLDACPPASASS